MMAMWFSALVNLSAAVCTAVCNPVLHGFTLFLDLARFEMGSHYRIVLNRHCFTSHQGSTVV